MNLSSHSASRTLAASETVLDALSNIGGLSAVSSKKMWVARPAPTECGHDQILPVDWCGITQKGQVKTNYQILPGDRLPREQDLVARFKVSRSAIRQAMQLLEQQGADLLPGDVTGSSVYEVGSFRFISGPVFAQLWNTPTPPVSTMRGARNCPSNCTIFAGPIRFEATSTTTNPARTAS